jgi:hypothetical protein
VSLQTILPLSNRHYDIQHNDLQQYKNVTLSLMTLDAHAECFLLNMLSVAIMPIMLSDIMLNVVMVSVMSLS